MVQKDDDTLIVAHIAYLCRGEFEDGKSYRGGILVVDISGKPLEFRCTSPIRPNPVQRTLYGDSLEPYMLVELMGKELLRSVRESIDLVLVNERWFLNVRDQVDTPTAFIRRQGVDLTAARGDTEGEAGALVDSPSGRFDPVVIEAFRDHLDDRETARLLLQKAAQHMDPVEPFERIMRALQKVHEEKVLDKK